MLDLWNGTGPVVDRHIHRYRRAIHKAAPWMIAYGREICLEPLWIEFGCGSDYGLAMIEDAYAGMRFNGQLFRPSIVGIDKEGPIYFSKRSITRLRIDWEDAESIELIPEGKVDAVIAVEFVEHLGYSAQVKFLEYVARILKPVTGRACITTPGPCTCHPGEPPANPKHEYEMDKDQLLSVASSLPYIQANVDTTHPERFTDDHYHEQIYLQMTKVGPA